MRRVLLGSAIVVLLALGIYGVYRLCLSDETRIRELVAGMAADFNEGAVGPCTDGLAEDFREEVARVGKQEVHQLLVALWLREKDPKTGGFPFRVELPAEEMRVTIDPARPGEAAVELVARFADVRRDRGGTLWQARIEARLAKVDGRWRVKSSRHETAAGRRPF